MLPDFLFFSFFPVQQTTKFERDWSPCNFFGLATRTLNVRNNNNNNIFQLLIPPKRFDIFSP